MADEIRMNLRVSVKKDAAFIDKNILSTNRTFTQTGVGGPSPGRVSVPTADTVISLAGFTTPGVFAITNHDVTNYVEFGPTVAGAIAPLIRLTPGESTVFRLTTGAVLRGRSNTAACICSIDGLEA